MLIVERTVLELLEALKCDFEFVLVCELCGVVHHLNPEKRNDRHGGGKRAALKVMRNGR
jgi:hypothetical protein